MVDELDRLIRETAKQYELTRHVDAREAMHLAMSIRALADARRNILGAAIDEYRKVMS